MVFGATITPIEGLKIQALLNWYEDNYADWSPESRQVNDFGDDGIEKNDDNNDGDYTDQWDTAPDNGEDDGVISDSEWLFADRYEVWKAPGYTKIDVHAYYDIPIQFGNTNIQAFLHIFNLFDEIYVQDAVDNSQYNGWDHTIHDADNAEVFLGTPRYVNAGINIRF